MKISRRVVAGAVALGVVAAAGMATAAPPAGRITVTGEGHVAAAPDMATIIVGVTTEGRSAADAMAQNTSRTKRVFAALKAAGVAESDMRTAGLSLNPRWQQPKPGGTRQVADYVAMNSVNVRVRALDKLGSVLDALVKTGANTVNGLSFGLADPGPRTDAAEKAAIADARHKADLFAKAAGVTLGPVLSVRDGSGRSAPRPMMRLAEASAGAVPVAGGQISVDASVTMVFAIQR